MDKKEQVAKLLDEFSEEYKDEYLKDLANQIDQIYNQPEPELREKIAEIVERETSGDFPESYLVIADQILSLLKEPVTEPCPECGGMKKVPSKERAYIFIVCPSCNGTGSK
jgi:transcription initiation factor TFIIIB Brf1 subunit/transcription initiation factor TFIIB